MTNQRFTPASEAQAITKQAKSQTAQARIGKSYGICPCCTRIHTLGSKGLLVRHGWKAHNVRHGGHSGFHIGGHGSLAPIGTKAGNDLALDYARGHNETGERLLKELPATIAQATENLIQEINAARRQSWLDAWKRSPEAPKPFTSVEEIQASNWWPRYMHSFSKEAMASRAQRMDAHRVQTGRDHIYHAALLEALVALNPVARD